MAGRGDRCRRRHGARPAAGCAGLLVRDPTPLIACLVASAVTYFTAHLVHSRYRLFLWLDALGLALVTVAGTVKGLDAGAGPVVAVVMGVMTASLGGIIRDILGHEPSIILRREIYVTAWLLGAVTYVALLGLGIDRAAGVVVGGLVAFGLRGLAITFGWSLPTYRARGPGHHGELTAAHGSVRLDVIASALAHDRLQRRPVLAMLAGDVARARSTPDPMPLRPQM